MVEQNLVLQARSLCVEFGGVKAANNVDLALYEGQLASIIGPNGSGKTTFLNLCSGYVKPTSGSVQYGGVNLTALKPRQITRLGIVRTFQLPQLFAEQTVLDNVLLALASREQFWNLKRLYRLHYLSEARELLEMFGIAQHEHRVIQSLPEGVRKLVDTALALALSPQILLMDEPTSGVSSQEKFDIMDTLVPILRAQKVTALVVEHDMELVERYMDRVIVWNAGTVLADGAPGQVLNDPEVIEKVSGVM